MPAHQIVPTTAAPQPLSFRKRNPRLFRALIAGGIVSGLAAIGGLIVFLPLSLPVMAGVGTVAIILHFGVLPSVGVYLAASFAGITLASVITGFKDKIGGFFGRVFSRKPAPKKPLLKGEVYDSGSESESNSESTLTESSTKSVHEQLEKTKKQDATKSEAKKPSAAESSELDSPPAPVSVSSVSSTLYPAKSPALEKGIVLRPEPQVIYETALKEYKQQEQAILKHFDNAIVLVKKCKVVGRADYQTQQSLISVLNDAKSQFQGRTLRDHHAWDTPLKDNEAFCQANSQSISEIHAEFDQVRAFLNTDECRLFTRFENTLESIDGAANMQLSDWTRPSSEKDADMFLIEAQVIQEKLKKIDKNTNKKKQAAYGDFVVQYDAWQAAKAEPKTLRVGWL